MQDHEGFPGAEFSEAEDISPLAGDELPTVVEEPNGPRELHSHDVTLRDGTTQTIHFYAEPGWQPGGLDDLPEGFEINENIYRGE